MLPSSLTNLFSADEKNKIKTNQESITPDEVIDQISHECCNGDREKGRIAYQEALKVLREKTVRQRQQQEEGDGGFLDNILDTLKGDNRREGYSSLQLTIDQ
jgi:hypothetical protein